MINKHGINFQIYLTYYKSNKLCMLKYHNMKNKIYKKLCRGLNYLLDVSVYIYWAIIILVLILTVFVAPFYKHKLLTNFVNDNWLYFLFALVIGVIFSIFIIKKIPKINKLNKFLICGSIILFLLQIYAIYGKLFVAGWDVHRLFYPEFENDHYFSVYPNNLFLKGVFIITQNILIQPCMNFLSNFISAIQNNTIESYNYFFFAILSAWSVLASVILSTLIVKKLFGNKVCIFFFIFSSIFIGLSPWIMVPYSDTFAMLFTTLILFSAINVKNKKTKFSIIAISTIIGFNIKPTVIFAFGALLIVYVIRIINNKNLIPKIKTLIPIGLCVVLTFSFIVLVKNNSGFEINKDDEHTMTHYLEMGLNPNEEGLCNDYDRFISESTNSVSERESANINQAKKYLKQMGLTGTIGLFAKKIMCNYGDGTFMWEKDAGPNFYRTKIGHDKLVNWIYDNYSPVFQILWFLLLAGCIFIIPLRNKNLCIYIISITLIFQTIFLTIFECGSRYLILYLPYYSIISVFGWKNFSAIIFKKFKVK